MDTNNIPSARGAAPAAPASFEEPPQETQAAPPGPSIAKPPQRPQGPLSQLEGTSADLLVAMSRGLHTADVAKTAASSTTLQKALEAQVKVRHAVEEFNGVWNEQAKFRLRQMSTCISNGWNRWTLSAMAGAWSALGFHDRVREFQVAHDKAAGPQSIVDRCYFGRLLLEAGRPEEVLEILQEGLESTSAQGPWMLVAKAHLLLNRPQDAKSAMDRCPFDDEDAHEGPVSGDRLINAMIEHSSGNCDAARTLIDSIANAALSQGNNLAAHHWDCEIAEAYAWIDDADKALFWMARSYQSYEPRMLPLSPFMRHIENEPVWTALRAAAKKFQADLPVPAYQPVTPPPAPAQS